MSNPPSPPAPRRVSRRAFSAAVAAVPLADTPPIPLPAWTPTGTPGERFEFPVRGPLRARWNVEWPQRKQFQEWLPALFERTLELDRWTAAASRLRWIFTGPCGGITVEVGGGTVRLTTRFFDSTGLGRVPGTPFKPARHPESIWEDSAAAYSGELKSITVVAGHRLNLRVLLNGREVLRSRAPLDLNRHQLAFPGGEGIIAGHLLLPAAVNARVEVDESSAYQEMMGFGGIVALPAFALLDAEGARAWWRLLAEYNLLLHREYPNGPKLLPGMSNWDRLSDASVHYYGDNFPNSEITDFEYLRGVRRLGGKVIFEFWELPPWARRKDADGKLTDAPDIPEYVRAMVRYCQVCREKTGAAPEIVGIQNEVKQSARDWQAMTLALRAGLDQAGFHATRIHMHNASNARDGIEAAQAFRQDPEVWRRIDYAAANLYDFQSCFHDPDAFDARLAELGRATRGKPFLAVELCVNSSAFQARGYRVAFAMAQLYHKALTQLDASALLYCWTLLNVEQPSYAWTRSLFWPDPEHGLRPAATSHQLRVFGAYSRRVREGMKRVRVAASDDGLLAVAFAGRGEARTLVLLNRSTRVQNVAVHWAGARFRHLETASPLYENRVEPAPAMTGGAMNVTVHPGAIATLSSVELGRVPGEAGWGD